MSPALYKQMSVRPFLNPKPILFGACLLNFLLSLMYVGREESQAQAAIAAGSWGYSEHWNPAAVMWEPFLLMVAVTGLLVNRWWSLLLSLVAATRVVYLVGYLALRGVHGAHDVPMFSWQAMNRLWSDVYLVQTHYPFEVILGILISVYAVLALSRLMRFRSSTPTIGG